MKETNQFPSLQRIMLEAKKLVSILKNRGLTPLYRWLSGTFSGAQSLKPIRLYWKAYGGWRAFVRSPYLWLAIALTVIMAPAWLEIDKSGSRVWPQLPLSILPNILGFSMGGMAIMLAFTGSSVFKYMTEDGDNESYFVKIVASFFHFIICQTIAIFLGLIGRIYSSNFLSFVGYAAMCYAILVSVATASQLFNTARIANLAASVDEDDISS